MSCVPWSDRGVVKNGRAVSGGWVAVVVERDEVRQDNKVRKRNPKGNLRKVLNYLVGWDWG